MFICSKAKMSVRLNDGRVFNIPRDYVGEIPEEVANTWFVQAAIKSGDIAVPADKKDANIEAAGVEAKEKKSAQRKKLK